MGGMAGALRGRPPCRSLSPSNGVALGAKAALASDVHASFCGCCPALVLAYAVMALVWPWAVMTPLNPLRAVEYFSHFFEKPWQELFDGALIPVPDMPRSYRADPVCAAAAGNFHRARRSAALALAAIAASSTPRPRPRGARRILLIVAGGTRCRSLITIAHPAGACTTASGISSSSCRRSRCSAGWRRGYLLERLARRGRIALVAGAAVVSCGLALPVIEMRPAASLRVHAFQPHRRRRCRRRRPLHARLLGPGVQAGRAGAARDADRAHGDARPTARTGRSRSAGRTAAPRSSSARIRDHLGSAGADFALMLGEFYCVA